jgi:Fe-S-cluster containining protein
LEYIVIDCERCGGWCCKGLNSSNVARSYWKVLSSMQVIKRNPWIPTTMNLHANVWCACKHLNESGLCNFYDQRDEVCRLYPNLEFFFMEYLNRDAEMYVPWCTYRSIILQSLNIPFEILLTGEECRKKYLQLIRENPELANNFHGSEILIKQAAEVE